jgi:hypothetical protein
MTLTLGRAAWRRAAVVLGAMVIALVAAELSARALAPAWLRARMREVAAGRALASWGSDAGWPIERDRGRPVRFMPGSRFIVRHDEYVHSVQIDDLGGRAPGRPETASGPIVPVFGDSFAFGLGVRDEETFVSLVGATMSVRLVNFGMPGSALSDQLDMLDRLVPRVIAPPACLFVIYLGNDLDQIAADGDADDGDTDAGSETISSWLFAGNRLLDEHRVLRRWYVVQWARALAVRAVNGARREPQREAVFALMNLTTPLARRRVALERAVDRLVRESARLHVAPMVIVIPDRFQVNETIRRDKAALYNVPVASYDPLRPNRLVADVLSARGIAFLDVTSCLQGRTGAYYVRDMHLTAAGHASVAACAQPFIAHQLGRAFGPA